MKASRDLVTLVGALLFAVATNTGAQYSVLYHFDSGGGGGTEPTGLAIGDSKIYGLTHSGGVQRYGAIFRINNDGTGYTNLHSFYPGAYFDFEGQNPCSSPALSGQMLYALTPSSYSSYYGLGSIGLVGVETNGTNYQILANDTSDPWAAYVSTPVISGSAIYYTAYETSPYYGMLRAYSTNGTFIAELHVFFVGPIPSGSPTLIEASLYGLAQSGGHGQVYTILTNGNDFTVLHNFEGGVNDGGWPIGSLTAAGATLYGMTRTGGASNSGTVFRVDTDGSGFQVLHSFTSTCPPDTIGFESLTITGSRIYGMTGVGGTYNKGTIFKINTNGTGYAVVHNFADGPGDGADPVGSLVLSGTKLYGVTAAGGTNTVGVLFSFDLAPTIATGSPLPSGIVGAAYTTSLSASGGTPPYSWSVVLGSLPEGLSLSNSTGVIGGLPTSATNASFTVQVTGADSMSSTQLFTLTIAPATRIIGVSGNLAFGSVLVGQTPTATLTITNSGNSTLNVSGISYPTGFSGTWSGSIAPGGSHNVTVTFAPTDATSYGGTVTVSSDATSGIATVSASGTGIPVTRIVGVSGNLAFGSVPLGATPTAMLTITNSGNSTLHVSGISYPTRFSGAWSGSIAAGRSHNVTVTFAPVAVASYGGTVTVSSDATSGSSTINASGTGVCVYGISPASRAFTARGGTNTFAVSTTSLCPWTATPSNSWVSIPTGSSGTGSGTVTYAVAPNATSNARTNVVGIASQTFTVIEAGNLAPQVSIAPVSPITLPVATVNLNATVTDDGAPFGTLTTTWSKVGGGGSVTFGNPNMTNTTATFSTNATYVLRLTASDGAATNSDTVSVTVNARPQVTSPPAVTNATTTVNGTPVVKPGESVCFTVGAYDPDTNSLSCLWNFGDGATSTDCNPCHVFTNCGPLMVTNIVTDGYAPVTNTLMVSVTCPFPEPVKLTMKSNFAPGKLDSATLTAYLDLPLGLDVTNRLATLDIGGVTLPFTLNAKGRASNAYSTLKLAHKGKKTSTIWQVTATLKGDWDGDWLDDGLVNTTTNATVTVPVLLLFDSDPPESFFAEKALSYKAKAGKSGTAK